MRAGEPAELVLGVVEAGTGERSGGVPVEAGMWVQTEQAEQPRGAGWQVAVGPGEDGADRGARIPADVELVQPLLAGQLGNQIRQRRCLAGGGQLGGDPQRKG